MLNVKNLHFAYQKTPVLRALNFNIQPGINTAIIGESGSGKSTLLKLLYGEYDLDSGHIFWKDTEILGPKHNLIVGYDFMKYVAQEFNLMPFISVEENIGKHLSNFFPNEKKDRTAELLEVVQLTEFAKTKVKLLSGGQKQRVALARALAQTPEILLLDEPFSHIDNFQKQTLRRRVFNYLKEKNIACLVATHDQEDVLGFADQIIVLNNQTIAAQGKPEDLYKNPESALVAAFFGEFNQIKNQFIYAHQLKMVNKSDIKVMVKNAYFKGSFFLIEASFNSKTIVFEHASKLTKGDIVYLEISK
ncbi:ABC-type Fe3+/spermidine/putrescine transport systems, ATPase components [Bizionia echini]|uniref:ABC-type Fe3+/spermidine/putrescine transport systems, ATPase components n=1 Tax=Bizionia echini TaxID=649333 RepID=A0A1I4ZCR3_9FLAO|nr:ABC transporter ATP-binding protein [Bizionia echini]SFN48046.1 ABC-type Fe3+/spermidine/putrescine transport systems, ATPase components [Bizionia echini]